MSAGVPNRPSGVACKRIFATSGLEWPGLVIGVSTNPGCTEFTRILSGAYWIAAALEKMRTAPLDAWYAALPCEPIIPQIDDMLMIEPPPARCMAGIAALVPRKTPVALISITRFHCSSVCSASRGPAVRPVWMFNFGSRPEMPGNVAQYVELTIGPLSQ